VSGDGVGIHDVRRGQGPPVVLLHGFACSHAVWAAVVERLGDGYETVAFDLPGFGASERIEGSFSLADLATKVDDALGSSGIVDAVVVGHSMGGMVAQHLYAKAPERVGGLVLCGTTSSAGTSYQQATVQLRELVRTQGSGALGAALGLGVFGADYRRTHAAQVEEFVADVAACDEAVLIATLNAITQFDLTDRLVRVTVPCAVVVGDGDPFVEDCRLLASSISGASLSVPEGVGHMEPIESPGEVAAAIEEVVRTVREKRGGQ
jgi:3-oxoadipate enol-lactonase